jgi:sugar lactone lactonase YvrE
MHANKLRKAIQTISLKRWLAIATLTLLVFTALWFVWRWRARTRPLKPLTTVTTLAGAGPQLNARGLSDPFGIAVDADDNVYVCDGVGGRIYRLGADGALATITEQLDMPSALVVAPYFWRAEALIVANTGAHTIVRVNIADGSVTTIAGKPDERGNREGQAEAARFNAPVGVAVAPDGTIYVADTYNDRICAIAKDGTVRTLAGAGEPGARDGRGQAAMFDTPCGLAVAADGSLFVADTGNHLIRRVTLDGTVTTVAGSGENDLRDGAALQAAFAEPTALALRRDGALFIADAASSALRLLTFGEQPSVSTLAGSYSFGLVDGGLAEARFNTPTGLAFNSADALLLADSGNGLVRALAPADVALGRVANAASSKAPIKAEEIRRAVQPRWPFEPPTARREIAGTFGEIRGEQLPDHGAWFHSGLDIPGAFGETVFALHTEYVTRPLAIEGVGGPRERLRLPLLGYNHVRFWRDQNDAPFAGAEDKGIRFFRDEQGQVNGLRVPRGTRINASEAIGTLNRYNHVHLIAGPASGEINALAALPLPGVSDTIPPVIEAVTLWSAEGLSFSPVEKKKSKAVVPVSVQGRVRIVVQAYDQADGNTRQRRLGLFRLGYQILQTDGAPVRGFEQPRYNLIFERLSEAQHAVALAYAEGSQSGYTSRTIFAYNVTNVVRDGEAREEFWDTTPLAAGNYLVRVLAEDIFGNQTRRDVIVVIQR